MYIGREETLCSQGITNTVLGLLSLIVLCDIINCDVLVLCWSHTSTLLIVEAVIAKHVIVFATIEKGSFTQ